MNSNTCIKIIAVYLISSTFLKADDYELDISYSKSNTALLIDGKRGVNTYVVMFLNENNVLRVPLKVEGDSLRLTVPVNVESYKKGILLLNHEFSCHLINEGHKWRIPELVSIIIDYSKIDYTESQQLDGAYVVIQGAGQDDEFAFAGSKSTSEMRFLKKDIVLNVKYAFEEKAKFTPKEVTSIKLSRSGDYVLSVIGNIESGVEVRLSHKTTPLPNQ